MSALPISAEARGRYRIWRAEQKRIAETVEAVFHDRETARLAGDLVLKRRLGRKRALRLLEERYGRAGARLFRVDWSPWFAFTGFARYEDGPDDHVQVRAITIGMSGSAILPWAIQFSDHALLRALMRRPDVNLTELVWSAHESARRLDMRRLIEGENERERASRGVSFDRFRVRAGDGAFGCELACVSHPVVNDTWLVQARTWLSDEQMNECQEQQIVDAGADGERLDGLVGRLNEEWHGRMRRRA